MSSYVARPHVLTDEFVPGYLGDSFGLFPFVHGDSLANQFDGPFLVRLIRKEVTHISGFPFGIESRDPDIPSCWHSGTMRRSCCWSIPCHNQANPLPTNDTPASDIPQCFQCPAMLGDGGVGNRKVRYRSARIPSSPSRGGRSLYGKGPAQSEQRQAVRSLSASGMKGSQSIWLLSRLRGAFSDSGKGRTDSAGIYFRRGAYWFEWTEAPTCLYQGQFPRGAPSFVPIAERFIQ